MLHRYVPQYLPVGSMKLLFTNAVLVYLVNLRTMDCLEILNSHSPVLELHKVKKLPPQSPNDPSSYSKPNEWSTTNININWNVNFEQQIIEGYVDLFVRKRAQTHNEPLILDTRDLKIHSVTNANNNESLNYFMQAPESFLGSKLEIFLPEHTTTITVHIIYETFPNSSGLKWLLPSQTAGKIHPYLFSQAQTIHARSFLPCQDTPAVKATLQAKVNAPTGLVVLMGAIKNLNSTDGNHLFKQPIPIPSYLIAIAVGALEFRKVSQRCNVWSEKEFVDKAAEEFSEVETILQTGESLLGPYLWGRFDILVLPPSFPFGGMENPCLTFTTPTLLAGDKSLINVIAHEISHSWTSNLVTNRNFEHFWLNEGFTVFIERKILGRMLGESTRHFHALLGWKDLKEAIKVFGPTSNLTKLVLNINDVDPDDAFSIVPYEKGHTFFFVLEQLVGGSKMFDPFLRAYIEKFKFSTVDTDKFQEFFNSYFKNQVPSNVLASIDWETWLFTPGMPPKPNYDKTLSKDCKHLYKRWLKAETYENFSLSDLSAMSALQICDFLALFSQKSPLSISKIAALTKIYSLNETKNCEIKSRWIQIGIRSRWTDIVPHALQFVSEQGRLKFTKVIFKGLYDWTEMRQQAIDTYQAIKSSMIRFAADIIARVLHLN